MNNFIYHAPTKVVFGLGAELEAGELSAQMGYKKALVHYGSESAVKSGLLQTVCDSLKKSGVDYFTLGGVVPNPRLSKVNEGIEAVKKEKADFILAVGGGSVIDSAKAIALGAANDGDVWDFYADKREPEACLPVACVLTMSAAGSEMSESSVITNDATGEKRGFSSDLVRCVFSLMNPKLTASVPPYQTACGCVDIMMHTLERYFTRDVPRDIIDSMAEGLLKTVMEWAPLAIEEPDNYEARAEIMWAGSLSHNGVTGDRNYGDWSCHQLEHELSGMFDVAHGAGLAAIWGSWARYVLPSNQERFAKLAANVFGLKNPGWSEGQKAALAISAMENFFQSIGMPTTLSELGLDIDDETIKKLAWNCSFGGMRTIGGLKELKMEDMANIYSEAR